jgi:hypothetical protein
MLGLWASAELLPHGATRQSISEDEMNADFRRRTDELIERLTQLRDSL